MKLPEAELQRLADLLAACALAGIDEVLIEEGTARGINPDRTCGLISTHEVPRFPQRVGLARLGKLRQRLTVLAPDGKLAGVTLAVKPTDREELAQLVLSHGQATLVYRCASASAIKAPRSFNDAPAVLVPLPREQLATLLNGARVLGADQVTLSVQPGGQPTFFLTDSASADALTVIGQLPAERVGTGGAEPLAFTYAAAALTAVLRGADDPALLVGERGTVTLLARGHPITIFPQVASHE
jgi:hypothetical protein